MTKDQQPRVNFKGVMCGVGLFTETLKQVDTSDLLLNLGLVDQHGYEEITNNIKKMKELVGSGNVTKALKIYTQTFGTTTNFSDPKFRLRRTGFLYNGNAMKPTEPEEHLKFVELMKNETFREDIHAGKNASFRGRDSIIMMKLIKDLYRSIDKELEFLLDNGTKVLIFLGQLDLKVSNVVTEEFVRGLKWNGHEDFKGAQQKPWWGKKDEKDFSGYFISKKVEEGGTLMLVKLLTSGHYPFFDQPHASTVMVRKFISDEEFITKKVNKSGVYVTDPSAKDEL
ncbi:probable serine carboxypeptidase CPVL [Ornithodoros turicata]|uniref:probable serine carboxypeptidase CPVL n=1 Tax=Ornithodoros turicata TaxID=34597 RepID=UPI003139A447